MISLIDQLTDQMFQQPGMTIYFNWGRGNYQPD
jgi:hypothetical protein